MSFKGNNQGRNGPSRCVADAGLFSGPFGESEKSLPIRRRVTIGGREAKPEKDGEKIDGFGEYKGKSPEHSLYQFILFQASRGAPTSARITKLSRESVRFVFRSMLLAYARRDS